MDSRASAFWQRLKSHRWGSSVLVLLTLAVGILIGTVISFGVKGQNTKNTSADATPVQARRRAESRRVGRVLGTGAGLRHDPGRERPGDDPHGRVLQDRHGPVPEDLHRAGERFDGTEETAAVRQ